MHIKSSSTRIGRFSLGAWKLRRQRLRLPHVAGCVQIPGTSRDSAASLCNAQCPLMHDTLLTSSMVPTCTSSTQPCPPLPGAIKKNSKLNNTEAPPAESSSPALQAPALDSETNRPTDAKTLEAGICRRHRRRRRRRRRRLVRGITTMAVGGAGVGSSKACLNSRINSGNTVMYTSVRRTSVCSSHSNNYYNQQAFAQRKCKCLNNDSQQAQGRCCLLGSSSSRWTMSIWVMSAALYSTWWLGACCSFWPL